MTKYFNPLRSVDSYSIEYNVTLDLKSHPVKCLTIRLEKLKYLKSYPKGKKRDTSFKHYDGFASTSKNLFDIISSDDRIRAQGSIWKIKMTESDYQFHENTYLVPQLGYSSSCDNQWRRTEKGKSEEEKQERREMPYEQAKTFLYVSRKQGVICHSVESPPFCLGELNFQPNFQKGELDRISTYTGGCWERAG